MSVKKVNQDLIDAELARVVAGLQAGLDGQELEALIDRMSEQAVRLAAKGLLQRALVKDLRLEAERDGWRTIARELLAIALGGMPEDWKEPPLEIIALHETQRLPAKQVAALEQFWARLTLDHARRRGRHGVSPTGHVIIASEAIDLGDVVMIDSIGDATGLGFRMRARRARLDDDIRLGDDEMDES